MEFHLRSETGCPTGGLKAYVAYEGLNCIIMAHSMTQGGEGKCGFMQVTLFRGVRGCVLMGMWCSGRASTQPEGATCEVEYTDPGHLEVGQPCCESLSSYIFFT